MFLTEQVWPHDEYPLIPVGKLVLDRNPENYFADVEQIAFDPAHMVPGIEASPDKMLQGRLFSYGDTHRHRLGPNHLQLPVNCPYKVTALICIYNILAYISHAKKIFHLYNMAICVYYNDSNQQIDQFLIFFYIFPNQ